MVSGEWRLIKKRKTVSASVVFRMRDAPDRRACGLMAPVDALPFAQRFQSTPIGAASAECGGFGLTRRPRASASDLHFGVGRTVTALS